MDCIFCKIIKGEINSYTIYEDDIVKVILDVNPVTNGHALVLPKKHYENLLDIDEKTLSHIHRVARDLYKVYKEKLGCDGFTLTQNNGYGQEIKHYHLHLIPRYKNDNIEFSHQKNQINIEDIYIKINS